MTPQMEVWVSDLAGHAGSSDFASLLHDWLYSCVLALSHRRGQELKDKEHKRIPSHKLGLTLKNLGLGLCM